MSKALEQGQHTEHSTRFNKDQYTRALSSFRRYMRSTQRRLTNYKHELMLLKRSAARKTQPPTFGYLVDYQIIYNYLAPFLRFLPEDTRVKHIQNHYAAAEFFENPSEPILLPLGTMAELNNLVRRVRLEVSRLLQAAELAQPSKLDDPVQKFVSEEMFLQEAEVNRLVGADLATQAWYKHQLQNIEELAHYEYALTLLHRVLSSPMTMNPSHEFLGPLRRISRAKDFYREIRSLLSRFRGQEGGDKPLNTIVDAFNVMYAFAVNEEALQAREQEASPTIYRLLTDTPVLSTLDRQMRLKPKLQITLRDLILDYDFELIEDPRTALYTRDLKANIGLHYNLLEEHEDCVANAAQALDHIDLRAMTYEGGLSVAEFLWKMIEPGGGFLHKEIMTANNKDIACIHAFVEKDYAISPNSLERTLREELLAGSEDADSISAKLLLDSWAEEFKGRDVSRISNLIYSIERYFGVLDHLGTVMQDFQLTSSNVALNRLLTLRNLGYAIQEIQNEGSSSIIITQLRTNQNVLHVEVFAGDYMSCSWPTSSSCSDFLRTVFTRLNLRNEVLLSPIVKVSTATFNGVAEEDEVEFKSLRTMEPNGNCAFIRLDLPQVAFISELFDSDRDYDLRTGILAKSGHLKFSLVESLFYDLCRFTIPHAVLERELWSLVVAKYLRTPSSQP